MEHDSAAALMGDDGIIAAIEEGKLARSRSIEGIPRAAIRFCLDRAGIEWRQLDRIVVASRPGQAWSRNLLMRARLAPLAPASSAYFMNKASGELGRELNNLRIVRGMAGDPQGRVENLDHHLCHAASSFFASPFDRALIVTLDEQGDGRAGFVGIGAGSTIREIASLSFPHSLAWVYTQVTRLLGFHPHEDEHKTQWLSLAGEPSYKELFLEMLRCGRGGAPHLNAKFFRREFAGELSFSPKFYERLEIRHEHEPRLKEGLRANVAASLQQACATVLVEWFESLRKQTDEKYLCLAGGLFLNPLLVWAIEKEAGFERVFVQPAAGNEGTSLGAAWLAWHQSPGRSRLPTVSNLFWGPAYSNEEIKQVLDNCKASYRWCDSEDRILEEVHRLLDAGKTVAWFQGPAEFGPRALGHRSLLASPWAPYVKENLNDYVKHRESFRPFALAIPAEDCPEYFDCSPNARFLTTMARARDKALRIFESLQSGFLSGDGLARVHVVTLDTNPLLWKLLKRVGEKSPAPMLVNTSFNLFGEPLVLTPRDAVRSFFCSGTDALLAGSFLLAKR